VRERERKEKERERRGTDTDKEWDDKIRIGREKEGGKEREGERETRATKENSVDKNECILFNSTHQNESPENMQFWQIAQPLIECILFHSMDTTQSNLFN